MFQRHPEDDPQEACPSADFLLNECPDSVAQDLIAVIDAVAASPPPQFTGGGMWEAMHGACSAAAAEADAGHHEAADGRRGRVTRPSSQTTRLQRRLASVQWLC